MIDSWRVIGVEPPRRLTLAFGIKAPGAGALEFEVMPIANECTRITVRAYWHQAGVWGLLYWYAFVPAHFVVLRGMARPIALRAETAGRAA